MTYKWDNKKPTAQMLGQNMLLKIKCVVNSLVTYEDNTYYGIAWIW